jgi:hypothetical protein
MSALSITAANVIADAEATQAKGVAGTTITAGMPVYLDGSEVYQKSRGNGATAAQCDGIALNGASSGQPFDILTAGNINLGATLVSGTAYYVSDATAGLIVPFDDLGSGDYPTFLGVADDTDNIRIAIQEGGVAKA